MVVDLDAAIRAALTSVNPRAEFSAQLLSSLEQAATRHLRAMGDTPIHPDRRWLAPVAVSAVGVAGAAWYGIRRHRKGAA
ncbi:MAG: hypothetical protein ABR579_03555 [Actinomycetota bacterium]